MKREGGFRYARSGLSQWAVRCSPEGLRANIRGSRLVRLFIWFKRKKTQNTRERKVRAVLWGAARSCPGARSPIRKPRRKRTGQPSMPIATPARERKSGVRTSPLRCALPLYSNSEEMHPWSASSMFLSSFRLDSKVQTIPRSICKNPTHC